MIPQSVFYSLLRNISNEISRFTDKITETISLGNYKHVDYFKSAYAKNLKELETFRKRMKFHKPVCSLSGRYLIHR